MEHHENPPNFRPEWNGLQEESPFRHKDAAENILHGLRVAAGAEINATAAQEQAPGAGQTPTHTEPPVKTTAPPQAESAATSIRLPERIGLPATPTGPAERRGETSSATGTEDDLTQMGSLLDLRLPVSIELGRTDLSIAEILELRAGSIVELDRMAGEPVDLRVNGQIVAKGEVVVIDERFGVRVTGLAMRRDRIQDLGA